MMKLCLAILICVGAFALSPRVSISETIKLDQIQTVSVKTYPHGTIQNRAWFVEMVD